MDFAFFVVNFGYTKADYEQITPTERLFIYKAWEDRHVLQTSLTHMAFMNVEANINRKKGKKAIPLWKPKTQAIDFESSYANYQLVQSLEKAQGKSWVDDIYQTNGLKRKEVMPID